MEAVDPNPSYGVISLGKDNEQCDTNPSYEVVLKKYAHSVPEHSNVFRDAKRRTFCNQSSPSDSPQHYIEYHETVH